MKVYLDAVHKNVLERRHILHHFCQFYIFLKKIFYLFSRNETWAKQILWECFYLTDGSYLGLEMELCPCQKASLQQETLKPKKNREDLHHRNTFDLHPITMNTNYVSSWNFQLLINCERTQPKNKNSISNKTNTILNFLFWRWTLFLKL